MRRTVFVFVLLAATAAMPAARQPPPDAVTRPADTQLRGRLFDAADGAALPRALIAVTVGDQRLAPVLADDRGRFAIDVPAAASYMVRVRKAAYATATLSVRAADATAEIPIPLARGAAVEGRVVDASGAPAVGVTVAARRQSQGDGSGSATPFLTETDDRGEFRLGGLPAGRYEVRAMRLSIPSVSAGPQIDAWRQRVEGLVERTFGEPPSSETPAFTVVVQPGDEVHGGDLIVPTAGGTECQPPQAPPADPAATSAVRGRITTADGRPLACASVTISRPGVPARRALTDAAGRYLIEGLAEGAYTLQASLEGYVPLQYGQRHARESGTPLTLRPDELLDRIDVALPRGSTISGTVVDEAGEPMDGVSVRALELRSLDGRTIATSPPNARVRRTDDRGQYRLFGLLPGSYLVSASVDAEISASGSTPGYGYAPVYFPGTTDPTGAAPLRVDVDRHASNTSLVFVQVPTARITGVVLDQEGLRVRGAVLLVVSHRSGAPALEPRQAQIGPDGSFTFTNVPYGDYVVQALGTATPPPAAQAPPGQAIRAGALLSLSRLPPFGMQYVTVVDGDPPPLVIRTSPGATLEGLIRSEGATAVPSARISLMAMPTDWDRSPAIGMGPLGFERRDDGTFSYAGLYGPRRIAVSAAPDTWYLKSIVIDGQDVTDRPFDFGEEEAVFSGADIVVSSEGAAIDGHATNERGEPVGSYAVVVFPVDRSLWFRSSRWLKFVRADESGLFRVPGLPPGSYQVAAADAIDGTAGGGEWQDPQVLDGLSAQARRVTLAEGERVTVALRVIAR